MTLLIVLLALFTGQVPPPPVDEAPVATTAPAEAAPAAPETPPSPRLEALLSKQKGQPQTTLTAKLGPPESIRQASDGQVLFWTVVLPGTTVCGPGADGMLTCNRVGEGSCALALAFKTEGGLTAWKTGGMAEACEAAADILDAGIGIRS